MHKKSPGAVGKGKSEKPSTSRSTPRTPKTQKRATNPCRRAFVERRAAARIIDKVGSKPAESLTPEENSRLTWARKLVAKLQETSSLTSSDAPKRQRSEEETVLQSQQPDKKRLRPQRSSDKSYSQVAKDQLVMAILDRGNPDNSITPANWITVKRKIMGMVGRVLKDNPGPYPRCEEAGWYRGRIKLMACADERSVMLLKHAIALLDGLWEGARIDVVPKSQIPRRPRAVARIPDVPEKAEEILELLRGGNPEIPTDGWKIVRVSESKGSSREITVLLNQECLAPLRERRGKMYFGFDAIFLCVYRGDDKGGLIEEVRGPDPADKMSVDEEIVSSASKEDSLSCSELVGEFFENAELTIDEDALLDSDSDDQEDANVTIVG